ncbi:MAG: DUF3794 domain-containing protein [Negativicutes bacterium]|nr:DUF3794 domain-containing protein [Negativicutes bacterium]
MPHTRSTSVTLRQTLNIPPHQPEAKQILRVTTSLTVDKAIVISKKLVFWGRLMLGAEYVARTPGKTDPVCLASFAVPFSGFVSGRRLKPDSLPTLHGEVEFQDYELLTARDIGAFILVKIEARRPSKAVTVPLSKPNAPVAACPCQTQTEKAAFRLRRPAARSTWTGRSRY